MELILTHQTRTRINVHCNGRFSHAFHLSPLQEYDLTLFQNDPIVYGWKLYEALFAPGSLAQRTLLMTRPDRLLLVTSESDIDALPWEYTYGPFGFLVLQCPLVRSLPADQCLPPPAPADRLRIVAVPSDPLSREVAPLNIEEEWLRLQEVIEELPYAITLERTRPSTLERTRHLLAGHKGQVFHFMGHGHQEKYTGVLLCFERDNGDLHRVTASEFLERVRDTVFLVILNACVSAAPGPTSFSNLASTLVQQKIPYALGMRSNIADQDARTFSRVFYSELARGVSVEEALFQTRLILAESPHPYIVGVPVLYTSLTTPTPGFLCHEGKAEIRRYQPRTDLAALPRVTGLFQGYIDKLLALGQMLTGGERSRLITIHGPGGQGKSSLAREAAERFAYAWPGGVRAISLENLPDRTTFVNDLARFLGINTQERANQQEVEHHILTNLAQQRTLLLLDGAETLVEAVEGNDSNALQLAALLRQLPGSTVTLLVTSRVLLGWENEQALDLRGLSPKDGAALFFQCVPQRAHEITHSQVQQLSQKVEGHPLSLRLLGNAFNTSHVSFEQYLQEYEEHLMKAEDIYQHAEHRQRKLYASIETSIKALDEETRTLLSQLSIFHASFLAETAATIFAPVDSETEPDSAERQTFYNRLQFLWQQSLLVRHQVTTQDKNLEFYHLLPVVGLSIQYFLQEPSESQELLKRFGLAYADLSSSLASKLKSDPAAVVAIAQQAGEDLERGLNYTEGETYIGYLVSWGQVTRYRGSTRHGLGLLERALEIAQRDAPQLIARVSLHVAMVYTQIGLFQEALTLYQQALPLLQQMGERGQETTALTAMATIYSMRGKWQEALSLYEQALNIVRELDDQTSETTIYNLMMLVYRRIGKPQEALKHFEPFLHALRKPEHVSLEEASIILLIAEMYNDLGKRQEALSLYEQMQPVVHELGNRLLEGKLLHSMALVCDKLGQREHALSLYEEALLIHRGVGNSEGEAITLSGMAVIYDATGKSKEALDLYLQILPFTRKTENRVGEAATLSNMAIAYMHMERLDEALSSYEQALLAYREVRGRAGEASTLAGIASILIHRGKGLLALPYCQEALSIQCEIENRAGEANTRSIMAEVYKKMGQLQQALTLYEEVLALRQEVGDRPGEALTLYDLAKAYEEINQLQKALSLYERALPIMREVGNRSGEAIVLAGMVSVYSHLGQLQEALTRMEEALPLLQQVGEHETLARLFPTIAEVYSKRGQLREALAFYKKALSILKALGNRADEATTLAGMARVYGKLEHPAEALPLYLEALPITREVGNRVEEAHILYEMAFMYGKFVELGKQQEALDSYQQALVIMRELGNRGEEAKILTGMAEAYKQAKKPQEALASYEQARSMYRETGEREGVSVCLCGMALVHEQEGRQQEAVRRYEEALLIVREVGNHAGEASILFCMARMHSQTGQLETALDLYKEALVVQQKVGEHKGAVTTLNSMAGVTNQIGRQDEALNLYEQALTIARQEENYAGEFTTLGNLAFLYQAQHRFNDAMAAWEQATALVGKITTSIAGSANVSALLRPLLQIRNQHFQQHPEYMQQSDLSVINKLVIEQILQLWQSLQQDAIAGASLPQLIEHIQQAAADLSEQIVDLADQRIRQSVEDRYPRPASPSSTRFTTEYVQHIVDTTILAMTEQENLHSEWREKMSLTLEYTLQDESGWSAEVGFLTAVLAILDGEVPTLSREHPYAQMLASILQGINRG